METIDNNYNSGGILLEDQKVQFKNSATWMKTYAIIIMIFTGLGVLIMGLVFGLAGDEIYTEVIKGLKREAPEARKLFEEIWPMAKVLMIIASIICVVQFFSMLQLFKSGKNFGMAAVSDDPSTLVSGFKSFKNFWLINGILIIISILLVIGLMVKLMPIIIEAAKQAR